MAQLAAPSRPSSSSASRLRRAPFASAVLALLAAAGCNASEGFESIGCCSSRLAGGAAQRLVVENGVGDVRITPAEGEELLVTAEVFVRESLKPQFAVADAARDLRVVLEGDTIRVENAHRQERRDDDFHIDLTITAPARLAWQVAAGVGNVRLRANGGAVTVNAGVGDVELLGTCGDVAATSGTGNVVARLDGMAGGTLKTGTGNVRLELAKGGLANGLACTSSTGNVNVVVPAELAAEVHLASGVGNVIARGGAVTVEKSLIGATATGRLGAGGPKLSATTATGNVSLAVGQ